MRKELNKYIKSDVHKIHGWLEQIDIDYSSYNNADNENIENESDEDIKELFNLISRYNLYTESSKANRILSNWAKEVNKFVKVIPTQYNKILLEKQTINVSD